MKLFLWARITNKYGSLKFVDSFINLPFSSHFFFFSFFIMLKTSDKILQRVFLYFMSVGNYLECFITLFLFHLIPPPCASKTLQCFEHFRATSQKQ